MTIAEQEDKLFEEWIKHEQDWLITEGYYKDEQSVYNLFCYDGLHVTGEAEKTGGYWNMNPDYRQDKLWYEQIIKPLFITKDYNLGGGSRGIDTRYDTGLDNTTDNVYYRFYARYLMLLYGITHITCDGEYPSLEEASNPKCYLDNFYHDAAVVRINAKKIAGGTQCSKLDLLNFVSHDKEFILRQIDLYNPNVVVCCDVSGYDESNEGSNPILHLLLKEKYFDAEPIKYEGEDYQFIYYSQKYNVVIIHEWHVSNRISYFNYYKAIPQLARLIKEKHLFFK